MEINSKEYWDIRFHTNWEAHNGKQQTMGFMKVLLENLPKEISAYIEDKKASILDWGCALGQGVQELAKRFPGSQVTRLDISDAAVEQCKQLYPGYIFRSGVLDERNDRFDVIVNSNCLEHFTDYLQLLSAHIRCANAYYVILVPYRELTIGGEHAVVLSEESFPERLSVFEKHSTAVVDTRSKGCWNGDQMLIVYKRTS